MLWTCSRPTAVRFVVDLYVIHSIYRFVTVICFVIGCGATASPQQVPNPNCIASICCGFCCTTCCTTNSQQVKLEMWANVQRDGRPAEYS